MPEEPKITFWTILRNVFSNWGNLIRSIIFVVSVTASLGFLIYFIFTRIVPPGFKYTTENGTSLAFEASDEKLLYKTLLVNPRGWVNSGLDVLPGNTVSITASGSINIAMGRMTKALSERYGIKENGKSYDQFTEEDIQKSLFVYPWTGPEGFNNTVLRGKKTQENIRKQQSTLIDPLAKLGQLRTVVASKNDCPESISKIDLNSFSIYPYTDKTSYLFVAEKQGRLCFIINDSIHNNPGINKIFWEDNLGFYSVKVKIQEKLTK